jgi:hypothetical protein
VFERIERQTIAGDDVYGAAARIQQALFSEGQVALAPVSPTSWVGKGPEVGLGFVLKGTLIAHPGPGGFALDLKLEIELEDKGIALLYASWVVCLPVAPFLLLFAWRDANVRKAALFRAAWSAAASPQLGGGGWGALPPAW